MLLVPQIWITLSTVQTTVKVDPHPTTAPTLFWEQKTSDWTSGHTEFSATFALLVQVNYSSLTSLTPLLMTLVTFLKYCTPLFVLNLFKQWKIPSFRFEFFPKNIS